MFCQFLSELVITPRVERQGKCRAEFSARSAASGRRLQTPSNKTSGQGIFDEVLEVWPSIPPRNSRSCSNAYMCNCRTCILSFWEPMCPAASVLFASSLSSPSHQCEVFSNFNTIPFLRRCLELKDLMTEIRHFTAGRLHSRILIE